MIASSSVAVRLPVSSPAPRVLAITTHWNQPEYLKQSVASLLAQTRPPDAIVVIDDASEHAPDPAVFDGARVSLYRSDANVGTFRLIDSAIRSFAFDWYLMQDCDDIAVPTRLERLLHAGLTTPADMVGSSLHNFGEGYPEQVESFDAEGGRRYVEGGQNWFCPWGGALFRRSLWAAVGGLSSGLRLGADSDFLHRAAFAGRIVNIPSVELHRRRHPGSLTLHPGTGEGSEARSSERRAVLARSEARRASHAAGAPPDLSPFRTLPAVPLTWLSGPKLHA